MEARRMPGGVPREGDPEPTGFPQYLSPQMHFMKRAASEDDWFAWAVLVWYLVEGSPPFGNEELSRSARLQKLGRVRPARIPAGAPLSDAIRGCLVLVPQDRAKTIARLPELLNQATCPGPPGEYQEIPRLPLPERVQRSARDPDKASEKQPTKPFGKSAILVLLLVLGGLLSLMSAIL
jgi:serine/threonine protein kinase